MAKCSLLAEIFSPRLSLNKSLLGFDDRGRVHGKSEHLYSDVKPTSSLDHVNMLGINSDEEDVEVARLRTVFGSESTTRISNRVRDI